MAILVEGRGSGRNTFLGFPFLDWILTGICDEGTPDCNLAYYDTFDLLINNYHQLMFTSRFIELGPEGYRAKVQKAKIFLFRQTILFIL